MRPCPLCSGEIQDAAVFCKHCHQNVLPKRRIATVGTLLIAAGALVGIVFAIRSFAGLETYPGERNAEATLASLPDLDLLATNHSVEHGYRNLRGEVKNISDKPIANLEVVVSYYDQAGRFVKSDEALVEFNPIMPAQASPFRSMTADNPAIAKYMIAFKTVGGGVVMHREE